MRKTLRVGMVQHSCTEEYQRNLAESEQGIRNAAAAGAELVLLPELHSGVYFCQNEDPARFDQAEPVPGPTTQNLADLARELGVVIVASVFERRAAGLYHNTAVVLERDGSIAGRYRKMHIPDDPGYYEKFYFTPGDQGFAPIETSAGLLGVLVCWDQWYPEAARLMALAGAQILLFPTAIGWDPGDPAPERERQRDSWVTIQRAHAIANGLPVVACNRVGHEADPERRTDGIAFWGSSFLAGPQGEVLAQASADSPAVVVRDVDLGRTEVVRRIWPFLRDRRIDAYQGLLSRYSK
ncbi:MAG: carbon-nitrogen hydrolase [Gammaproteobacteria bacterium]|nr:carbon-nitrogen hydrolase [Gammaproteobacteria bacterium]